MRMSLLRRGPEALDPHLSLEGPNIALRWLDSIRHDTRLAVRTLFKNPGFTTFTVATLALAIGVNTALFTIVNAVLLRALPFRDAGRLVAIWSTNTAQGRPRDPVSFPDFEDWRHVQALSAISPVRGGAMTVTSDRGESSIALSALASASLLSMLGVNPIVGRSFTPAEDQFGAPRVAILSESYWREHFGGDRGVLGRTLRVEDDACVVIGVIPDIELPTVGRPAVWVPLSVGLDYRRQAGDLANRSNRFLAVIGRLAPNASFERAQAELSAVAAQAATAYPNSNKGVGVAVVSLQEQATGSVRAPLLALFVAVGLLLLMACANLANMMLARVLARRREVAVRIALGCGRGRLVQETLTQNVVLAIAGGGCGLVLAQWLMTALVTVAPKSLPRMSELHLDGRVFAFTALVSAMTAVLFGLGQIAAIASADPNRWLKESDRAGGGGRGHGRLRSALLATEIALSVTLLIGAGLALRSFWALGTVPLGFDPEQLLAVTVTPPATAAPPRQAAAYDEMLRRIGAIPGVESVGATQALPLRSTSWDTSFKIVNRPPTPNRLIVGYARVAGDYLRTMRVPLRRGRLFTEFDRADAPRVTVVNDAFAARYFPNENPLGARLIIWEEDPPFEIVGVVANTTQRRLDVAPDAMIYLPYAQRPRGAMTLIARTNLAPGPLAAAVRREVAAAAPGQRLGEFVSVRELLDTSLAPRRYPAMLLTFFALLAGALAALGVYAVTAYSVTQRTAEIGVRLALGARPSSAVRLVLRQCLQVALCGVIVGAAGARALTGVMRGLIFGISANDPVTFAAVPLLLLAVALLAAYVPARRASRVDPLIALRHE